MSEPLRIEADPPSLGIALGCVVPLIAGLSFFLNPGLSIVTVIVLVPYFLWDHRRWTREGVRAILIDAEGITVWRGPERREERIARERITEVDAYRKRSTSHLQVLLGAQATRVPGVITLYEGPKLYLTDETFPGDGFERIVERIREIAPPTARVCAPLPKRAERPHGEGTGDGGD